MSILPITNLIGSLKNIIRGLSNNKEDWIISARRNYAKRSLSKKLGGGNCERLTKDQILAIESFWAQYHKKANRYYDLGQYEVYNKYCKDKSILQYYIPDDFYYCYADTFFTNYHNSIKIDNKNLYDLLFKGVKLPETIVRNINGLLLDGNYNILSKEEAIKICVDAGDVVIKAALNSDGGHGVCFVKKCAENRDKLTKYLLEENNFVIQKIIKQHSSLAQFNRSINTIRIMTLYFEGEVRVLSSVLRMGINGSLVDNASSGGIVCGIKNNGSLKDCAYDSSANYYPKHPNGLSFVNIKVPSYDKCVEIAKDLAPRFLNYTKLISWDFAIDMNSEPVLIEANLTGGQLDFHQLCNGPIWGNITDKVLKQIFEESTDINKRLQ